MAAEELSVVLSTLGNYDVLGASWTATTARTPRRTASRYRRRGPGRSRPRGGRARRSATRPYSRAADHRARRRGCPRTATRAGARREAPIVLFTDNDTIPAPRLVAEHLEWHRRQPRGGGGGRRATCAGRRSSRDAVHALARPRHPVRLRRASTGTRPAGATSTARTRRSSAASSSASGASTRSASRTSTRTSTSGYRAKQARVARALQPRAPSSTTSVRA